MRSDPMQNAIETAYLVGKREWTGVTQPALDAYARHVLELRISASDLERHGSELYLALACGKKDREALRILEQAFLPELQVHLHRSGFDRTSCEDALQQLLLHLCAGENPRILTYAGRAALISWLRVVTLRFAINMNHGKIRSNSVDPGVALSRAITDEASPDLRLAIETARPLFKTALTQALADLSDRDTTLLRLFFVDGTNIDGIGKLYGVHRATAARWIADIRRRILHSVKHKLNRDFGVSASEFDSLALLVRSQLSVSLMRAFGAA